MSAMSHFLHDAMHCISCFDCVTVCFYVVFQGPSTAIDTACSSSLLALENAFNAIRHGQCDAALVGGVNLLLKPNTSVQFMKLGMLSPDGTCKSFDASGDLMIIPED